MELISTEESAQLLGVTPRVLYRLIDAHRLHVYRYGRTIRLDRDEVANYDPGFDGLDDQLGDGEPRVPQPPPRAGAIALPLPRTDS